AQEARKKNELKIGAFKMLHRLVPIALAPFFPILATIGYLFGTSRAFNKIIKPILKDSNSYPEFLEKIIKGAMKIAEGEIIGKDDKFTKSFVVSDRIIDIVKPEILNEFSKFLSDKMSLEDPNKEVP